MKTVARQCTTVLFLFLIGLGLLIFFGIFSQKDISTADDTDKATNAVDTAGAGEDQDAAGQKVDGDEEIKKDGEGK